MHCGTASPPVFSLFYKHIQYEFVLFSFTLLFVLGVILKFHFSSHPITHERLQKVHIKLLNFTAPGMDVLAVELNKTQTHRNREHCRFCSAEDEDC